MDHNKLWKILKEMGVPYHLTCLLRNLYAVKKQQLELNMEIQTDSKLGKEYIKAVYRHPAYLTYMQRTSCETSGWMKHKLESRLPGEISITSDMQMIPPLWQKVKSWKKIFHANRDQKKAGVAIPISDKIDFKTKAVKRNKEGHYIMIKILQVWLQQYMN